MWEYTKNYATGVFNSTKIRFSKASTGDRTMVNIPKVSKPFSNYMLAGAGVGAGIGAAQAYSDDNKGILRNSETIIGAASTGAIAGAGLKFYLNRPKPLGLTYNKSTV
jgi:hypothetical protein